MVGHFDRIIVYFGGRDENGKNLISEAFIAYTQGEMNEIERKFDALDRRTIQWMLFEDRIVKCCCSREVYCGRFTNPCECGREYHLTGSLLADGTAH